MAFVCDILFLLCFVIRNNVLIWKVIPEYVKVVIFKQTAKKPILHTHTIYNAYLGDPTVISKAEDGKFWMVKNSMNILHQKVSTTFKFLVDTIIKVSKVNKSLANFINFNGIGLFSTKSLINFWLIVCWYYFTSFIYGKFTIYFIFQYYMLKYTVQHKLYRIFS